MENSIIINGTCYCLFCGKPIESSCDGSQLYYECSCPDAKETKRLTQEILKLRDQYPRKKYHVISKLGLIGK